MVALYGENGAGKTNLLEALSLFTPGRGLRRAAFNEMARTGQSGAFAVSITVEQDASDLGGTRLGTGARLGTGLDPASSTSRKSRIDGTPVSSPAAFAEYIRVVWLTPALDGLFTGPAGDRRRFLDRLVLAVDAAHGTRTNAYERALRQRNRILEEAPGDRIWLDSIEREIAELGVAVSAARLETTERLKALIAASASPQSPFPSALLDLEGEIESRLRSHSATEVEDHFRRLLHEGRNRDKAAGRTLTGPQTSDLAVEHAGKAIAAGQCSTGEQKALLIGLVLAHARLVTAMSGIAPLVLLDEVAAHLDPRRRAALFETLTELGCQVWMTGADPSLFAELGDSAMKLVVASGGVSQSSSAGE